MIKSFSFSMVFNMLLRLRSFLLTQKKRTKENKDVSQTDNLQSDIHTNDVSEDNSLDAMLLDEYQDQPSHTEDIETLEQ